jgi:hypothetical protein
MICEHWAGRGRVVREVLAPSPIASRYGSYPGVSCRTLPRRKVFPLPVVKRA